MQVAVLKELFPGAHRVALVPAVVSTLVQADHAVLIASHAGLAAGFGDADYEPAGERLDERDEACQDDCGHSVRTGGAAVRSGGVPASRDAVVTEEGERWANGGRRRGRSSVGRTGPDE